MIVDILNVIIQLNNNLSLSLNGWYQHILYVNVIINESAKTEYRRILYNCQPEITKLCSCNLHFVLTQ